MMQFWWRAINTPTVSGSEVDGERVLNEAEVPNLDLEFVHVNIDFFFSIQAQDKNMSKHPFFHPHIHLSTCVIINIGWNSAGVGGMTSYL